MSVMVVLFRSRLTNAAGEHYASMNDAMLARARAAPGFVDVKSFTGDDGERLTIVWWQDEVTLGQWSNDAAHRVAQNIGREQWYEYYKMDVAQIVRVSNFDRSQYRPSDLGTQRDPH